VSRKRLYSEYVSFLPSVGRVQSRANRTTGATATKHENPPPTKKTPTGIGCFPGVVTIHLQKQKHKVTTHRPPRILFPFHF
jgi:hypothetical protein